MTKYDPIRRKSGRSMLERAAEAYDFDAFFKGPGMPEKGMPEGGVPAGQPAPLVAPQPVVVLPAPVVAPADVAVPAPVAAHAPIAPVVAPSAVVTPVAPAPEAAVAAPSVTPAPRLKAKGNAQPIDRDGLVERGMIVPGGQVSGLAEEYRIVKRTMLRKAFGARNVPPMPRGNRILVASANPGEGKTFSAVNLALSMAQEQDHEVLLVDADFAKPSVLAALGLSGGKGLMDALADPNLDVADCLIATDIPNLMVLPAGQQTTQDTEYLASAHTTSVIDRLCENAPNRIIIFDSPPVLAASPAIALSALVGQVLMVVRADVTKESSLRDAISLLAACDDMMLLLNGVKFTPGDRKFGTYYGYGE
jgi:exopolysaccharide/PEP-CTERM locus tyrosine autokinase